MDELMHQLYWWIFVVIIPLGCGFVIMAATFELGRRSDSLRQMVRSQDRLSKDLRETDAELQQEKTDHAKTRGDLTSVMDQREAIRETAHREAALRHKTQELNTKLTASVEKHRIAEDQLERELERAREQHGFLERSIKVLEAMEVDYKRKIHDLDKCMVDMSLAAVNHNHSQQDELERMKALLQESVNQEDYLKRRLQFVEEQLVYIVQRARGIAVLLTHDCSQVSEGFPDLFLKAQSITETSGVDVAGGGGASAGREETRGDDELPITRTM